MLSRRMAASSRRRKRRFITRKRAIAGGYAQRRLLIMLAPPALALTAFVAIYTLGNLDLVGTQTALAAGSFLLLLTVLYFPLRYRSRLAGNERRQALLFAGVWLLTLCYPIAQRLYPPLRLATLDLTRAALPVAFPTATLGRKLDVEIIGHLRAGLPGTTRAASWDLAVRNPPDPDRRLHGRFLKSFATDREGSRENSAAGISRIVALGTLPPLSDSGAAITSFQVRGQAQERLTIGLRPHAQPPLWLSIAAGLLLLLGAARFDRASGAGRTAASLTIATGAAWAGALAFPAIGSVEPTFRELFGAVIVGALLGGPLGGVAAWLMGARRARTAKGPHAA